MATITIKQFLAGEYWSVADPISHPIDQMMQKHAVEHSKTEATFKIPGGTTQLQINGTNLKFASNGDLIGGTIHTLTYLDHGVAALVGTGFSIDAARARVAFNQHAFYPVDHDPKFVFDGGAVSVPGENNLGVAFAGWAQNDQITGSGFDDYLAGITGNDKLKGMDGNDFLDGGSGKDKLLGGNGIDTLVGNAGNDTLDGGAGRDWVRLGPDSTSTIALKIDLQKGVATSSAYGRDKLVSIESATGDSGNDRFIGNGDANSFLGYLGNDSMDGGGGDDKLFGDRGVDTMRGGAGADTFAFYPGSKNADIVKDFAPGTDMIVLHTLAFTSIAAGVLSAANFVHGSSAQDADDFIIYQKSSGKLFYDADGNGAGGKQLLATFTNHADIHASDIEGIQLGPDFWL